MKVFLAADHRGLELKNILRDWLKGEGYETADLGATESDKDDDYPDFGFVLAKKVAAEPGSFGVAVCGSGVGMGIAANKVDGVRAVLAHDVKLAVAAKRDDDVNVISIGTDFISEEQAKGIIKAVLETNFSGAARHRRRIDKITRYENG
ncbi:MAG: RpiB/LacA/LacB family sugar-phosphate isomerase [bacterium]